MGDVEVQKPVGLPVGSSPMNDTFDLHRNLNQGDSPFSLQSEFSMGKREEDDDDEDDDDEDDDDEDDDDSDEGDWILEDELAKLRAEWDDYVDDLEGELESGEFSPLDMEEKLKKLNEEWGAIPEVVRTNTKVKFRERLVSIEIPPAEIPAEETINYHVEVERRDVSNEREGGGDMEELDVSNVKYRPGHNGVGERQLNGILVKTEKVDQEGKGDAEVKVDDSRVGIGVAAEGDDGEDSDDTLEGEIDKDSDIYAEQLDASLEIRTERTEPDRNGGDMKGGQGLTGDLVKEDTKAETEQEMKTEEGEDKRTTEGDELQMITNDKSTEPQRIPPMEAENVPKEEQVLIERDGKFELKKVSDLSPEERDIMGIAPSPATERKDFEKEGKPSSKEGSQKVEKTPKISTPMKKEGPARKDTPSKKERPSTALGYQTPPKQSFQRRRVQSAKPSPGSDDSSGYERPVVGSSPYGLTPEQKELRRKQQLIKNQRLEEKLRREEEEKRLKNEEAEAAFQAWVKQKKQEAVEKKKQEKQKPKGEPVTTKKDPKEAHEMYEAWLKMKKKQSKLERKVKQEKKKEEKGAFFYRDRKECDAAFNEWVKMKRKSLKEDNAIKRSSGAQATAQKPRKARNPTKTSQAAQTYKKATPATKGDS